MEPTDQQAEILRLAAFVDHVSEIQNNLPVNFRNEERADLKAVANILRRTVTAVNVDRLRDLARSNSYQGHYLAKATGDTSHDIDDSDSLFGFATCKHVDCLLVRK